MEDRRCYIKCVQEINYPNSIFFSLRGRINLHKYTGDFVGYFDYIFSHILKKFSMAYNFRKVKAIQSGATDGM